jgi:uncharacterized repeat protein (TIGR01451 family)
MIRASNASNDPNGLNNAQSYTPTLRLVADVRAASTSLPVSVISGLSYSGTITCANAGPSVASGVSCSIAGTPSPSSSPVPNFQITACTDGSSVASGANVVCNVSYVAPSAVPLLWQVIASSANSNGSLTIMDSSAANNIRSYTPSLQEVAHLKVTISGLSSSANASEMMNASATCMNEGPSVASAANCVVSFNPSVLADKSVSCLKNNVGSPIPMNGTTHLNLGESIVCAIGYRIPSSGSVMVSVVSSSATPERANPSYGGNGVYENSASFTTSVVSAKIDVVESAGTVRQVGRFKFEVPYVVKVGNVGAARVYKAQVDNDLSSTFSVNNPVITVNTSSLVVSSSGAACVINTGFNGITDTRLLNGQSDLVSGSSCEIRFVATVDYSNAGTVPSLVQMNRSFASGVNYLELINNGSSSHVVFETSDYSTHDGSVVPNPEVGGDAGSPQLPGTVQGDMASMTPVSFSAAKVDVVLGVGTPKQSDYVFNTSNQLQTYTFDVPMKVLVGAASGAGINYGVQANVPLQYMFTDESLQGITTSSGVKAGSMSVVGVNGASCTLNNGFNGGSDTRLLAGTDTIKANQGCLISYVAQIVYQGNTSPSQPHVYPLQNKVFGVRAYGSGQNPGVVNAGHSFSFNGGSLMVAAPNGYTTEEGSTSAGSPQTGEAGTLATVPTPSLPSTPGADDPGLAVNVSFGLQDQSVSGYVYVDWNENKKLDEGKDEPVSGILLDLVDARGETPLRNLTNHYTVSGLNGTSGSDGRYTIIGVPPGNWTFRFRRGSNSTILATTENVPVLLNNASLVNDIDSLPQNSAEYAAIQAQLKALGKALTPTGFVYDAITRERYGNVKLYLQYCGQAVQDSCPRVVAGQGILPNEEVGGVLTIATETPDKGSYGFNFLPGAPAGVYRIEVDTSTLPAKTSYPSEIWNPEIDLSGSSVDRVPVIREVDSEGVYYASTRAVPSSNDGEVTRYYTVFRVESSGLMSKLVSNHIPLDRETESSLFIRKEADRKQVEIGDSLLYRITVRATPYAFNPATIIDALPLGFKLIPGTAKRMNSVGEMEVIQARDMEGGVGPILSFKNLYLKHGKDYVIEYRVRANVGSDRGTGTNSAYAMMGSALKRRVSQVSKVKVEVSAGVFTKEGCVIGKVYVDCNGNNQQEELEPGVAGVVLVMQDGTSITTDMNGQYSLCGLKPMTSVLKVDERSLPEGGELGLVDSRNMGNPNSRFVDVKDGELHRADFRILGCSKTLLENLYNRVKQQEDKNPPALPIKGEVRKSDELESKIKAKSNTTFTSKKNAIKSEKMK